MKKWRASAASLHTVLCLLRWVALTQRSIPLSWQTDHSSSVNIRGESFARGTVSELRGGEFSCFDNYGRWPLVQCVVASRHGHTQQLPTCVRHDCIVVRRSCLSCGANRERCGTAELKTHTQVDNMELATEKLAHNTCSRHHPANVSVTLCAWPNSHDCNCMCADKNKRHQRCLRACVCGYVCGSRRVCLSVRRRQW